MRIVVTGGTGVLGRAVAASARRVGYDVVTVSRREMEAVHGIEHRRADLVTGEGLDAALAGADAVVDATNSARAVRTFFTGGTKNLLDAAVRARVRHVVAVSIVGIDDAPIAYYRAKKEQERVVAASSAPWSLVRATQFHDLVAKFASGMGWLAFAPRGVPLQPVDAGEFAAHLVEVAAAGPGGRLPDFAGPEVRPFDEFAAEWRRATGGRRLVVPVPLFGRVAHFLRGGGLCNPNAARGRRTFGDWLRAPSSMPSASGGR